MKFKKINNLPLSTVTFYLPDYAPDGTPMPEVHEDLQEKLISEFVGVHFSTDGGELYLNVNGELLTDPCTKYTVFIEDSRVERDKLGSIIKKYATKLDQDFVVVTDTSTNILEI